MNIASRLLNTVPCMQALISIVSQTDRQMDGQTDRRTDGQTDREVFLTSSAPSSCMELDLAIGILAPC